MEWTEGVKSVEIVIRSPEFKSPVLTNSWINSRSDPGVQILDHSGK